MAKIGKKSGDFDPFTGGKQAFDDLGDVLGALEPPQHESAEKEEKPGPPARNPVSPRVHEASGPTRDPQEARPAVGGGGESSQELQPLPATQPERKRPKPIGAKKSKRFMATAEESAELDRAAIRLGAALGMRVDFSKLMRALFEVYLKHEDDVLKNIPQGEVWSRPSNLDPVGLAELEEDLARLIEEGLGVGLRRPANARRKP